MTYVLVQRGSWPGWSPNADIYLEAGTAAAYLTAARDYHTATGRTDAGIVEPLGGLRTAAQIAEMQWAFDHRGTAQSAALYQKYNMDPNSHARPATSSTHFLGICVDVASTFFLDWMITNGARYGLKRTIPGPPWNDIRHFQFFPGTATAALNVTSLDNSTVTTQEDDMTSSTRVFQMTDANGADVSDWSRIGPDVLPVGTFPGGYEATADHGTAVRWIAQYGQDATGPVKRPRVDYIAQQQFGAKEYQLHQTALAKLIAGNSSGSGGPVTVNAQVDVIPELIAALKDPTVLAALSAAIKVPTKIESTLS